MPSTPTPETSTKHAGLEKLRECFQNELSATETYMLALKSVPHVGLHHTLQEILTSHDRRVEHLRESFAQIGAEPPTSSGAWGAFAKAIQAGADLLGNRAAIAALESGEDRSVELYTKGLEGCDARTRKIIDTELLTAQQHTHELARSLKQYVNAPS